ncbi:glycoside hydrolase family 131 protein [Sporormia fimetaria CBS 119925]|uniref:Glycoside hydrolase family 131 protein n=1 Tax=Sporormia fimetaria CBS 119925 TaxID=1340428 RepID=A0A6A6UXK5_9PLEO|nr:glycoside hydrolase family 131 protein [Sporormia fimetaria CBS 119925]
MLGLSTVAVAILLPAFASAIPKHHDRIQCPVIFDARIPVKTSRADFNDPTRSLFNTEYVKGQNLTWSSIIEFPNVEPSVFEDRKTHKPFEVTIDNDSIFVISQGPQIGFRRAGLLHKDDANEEGADEADKGVVTFHWSVKQDPKKPLNLTHEYMNVWHERGDYMGNQFTFSMGLLLPQDGGDGINTRAKREQFRVQDNKNNIIFDVPIDWKNWQNFAVQLDHDKSTIKVFYSKGKDRLRAVTKALPNDNTGGGQLQLGMAKKPTETETVVWDGYHEVMKKKEGQIYGGVFVEDNTQGRRGCFSE